MSGWRTVDSAKAKPAPEPGIFGMRPKWPDGACKYEMDDGLPCGAVFKRNSHNQKACDRHTASNVALITPRVARKRKPE